MATPSLEALINDLIDQRLRQMQTSYPAEVVSYDAVSSTVTVKPLFLEAWRGPDGTRITEPFENEEDTYVENVIVGFPRMGNFRIAYPITAGDTGLVVVTKYSLNNFREGAGQADPGNVLKFGMSGSVFLPLNLTADADKLDATQGEADSATVITLGTGGTTDFLCLYTEVLQNLSDLDTAFNGLVVDFNNHVHVETGGDTNKPKVSSTRSYSVTDPKNAKVKVE